MGCSEAPAPLQQLLWCDGCLHLGSYLWCLCLETVPCSALSPCFMGYRAHRRNLLNDPGFLMALLGGHWVHLLRSSLERG